MRGDRFMLLQNPPELHHIGSRNQKLQQWEPQIAIGKTLMLSLSFPPLHTGHATFTASGVPSTNTTTPVHHVVVPLT